MENIADYKKYVALGDSYKDKNPNLAYLCYENALYYCLRGGGEGEAGAIREMMTSLSGVSVRPVSFIILSYNTLEYTQACLSSIRSTCFLESAEVVVVDNASTDGSREWLRTEDGIVYVESPENLGFSGGCNAGIKAASPENDIFLLNNDTLMMDNSLFNLRMGLYSGDDVGAAGSVSNYVANNQMIHESFGEIEEYIEYSKTKNLPGEDFLENKSWLVGFAMLIKRPVLEKVGYLDERFNPGNYEDNDLGLRISLSGYRNVLCHNSFILHFGSQSFKKGGGEKVFNPIIERNRSRYKEKWGLSPDALGVIDMNVLAQLQGENPGTVLEIGCGAGDTLARLKYQKKDVSIYGLENQTKLAKAASAKFPCDVLDIVNPHIPFEGVRFDRIIINKALERCINPEALLNEAGKRLAGDGYILLVVSNLTNAKVINGLLKGRFEYSDLDYPGADFLRLFTLSSILSLTDKCGMVPLGGGVSAIGYPGKSLSDFGDFFNDILRKPEVANPAEFDAAEYIIKVVPKGRI